MYQGLAKLVGAMALSVTVMGCAHDQICQKDVPYYKREGFFYEKIEQAPDLNMWYRIEYSNE